MADITITEVESNIVPTEKSAIEQKQAIKNLVINYHLDLRQKQEEVKTVSKLIKDNIEHDKEFAAIDEKYKMIAAERTKIKKAILAKDFMQAQQLKLYDLKKDLKDLQTATSDYLNSYVITTGETEIQTLDGEFMKIRQTAKLVKQLSLF